MKCAIWRGHYSGLHLSGNCGFRNLSRYLSNRSIGTRCVVAHSGYQTTHGFPQVSLILYFTQLVRGLPSIPLSKICEGIVLFLNDTPVQGLPVDYFHLEYFINSTDVIQ